MRVAIFGATGRLGRELVEAALAEGHSVTAHSRQANLEQKPRLAWVTDASEAVRSAGAVFIVFGPRSPQDQPFCRAQTQQILEIMQACDNRRLLCVTGAMVGDYRANRTWCFQRFARRIQERYPETMKDRAEQENVIRASKLDWSIFKPPRLTTARAEGEAVAGPAIRVGLLSSVSRAGLARMMLREAAERRFVRQAVFVRE